MYIHHQVCMQRLGNKGVMTGTTQYKAVLKFELDLIVPASTCCDVYCTIIVHILYYIIKWQCTS